MNKTIKLFLVSVLPLLVPASSALASSGGQPQQASYSLKLLLDGNEIFWDPGEGTHRNGEYITVDDLSEPLTVFFEGGELVLDLADYGTFSHPHILGVRFLRGSDPNTMSLGATVRHDENGWDDYADVIVFEGAQNGRRVLQHPHSDEPFTRSRENVRAEGRVRVYAQDNVRSGEGSMVVIDFSQEPFRGLERGTLRYELVRQPEH